MSEHTSRLPAYIDSLLEKVRENDVCYAYLRAGSHDVDYLRPCVDLRRTARSLAQIEYPTRKQRISGIRKWPR